jgi:hypothetical protein
VTAGPLGLLRDLARGWHDSQAPEVRAPCGLCESAAGEEHRPLIHGSLSDRENIVLGSAEAM